MKAPCQRCKVECFYDGERFLCDDCDDLIGRSEAMQSNQASKFVRDWIPNVYRNLNADRLPNPKAFLQMIRFNPSVEKPAIYAYGPTGMGKSRSLCARLFDDFDYYDSGDVMLFRGRDLSNRIVEFTRPRGKKGFDDWIRGLRNADVLGIDEFDKAGYSERVADELGDLIEHRLSNSLPTYFVAQCPLDEIAKAFSKKDPVNTAGLVRRIVEFCQPIYFGVEEAVTA